MNTSDLVGQVAATLRGAKLDELRAVDELLRGLIDDAEPIPPDSRAVVVEEERRVGRVTYRLQGIRCSKDGCRCMKGGAPHGPYWYGFYRLSGRVRSLYVGKAFKEARRLDDGTFIVDKADAAQTAGIECPTCEETVPVLVTYIRKGDGHAMKVCESCRADFEADR